AIKTVKENRNEYPYNSTITINYLQDKKLSYDLYEYKVRLADYYRIKAKFFKRKGRNKRAIKNYTKGLYYESVEIESLLDRGSLYLKKKRNYQRAKADFEKVLLWSNYDYDISFANFGLGKYYYFKSEYEKAINYFNISIGQNPENAWVYYYLSSTY